MHWTNMATNPMARAAQIFSMRRPLATHWRQATCAEVRCPHYINGWRTDIDEGSTFGQGQASYIRRQSGRKFREEKIATGITQFTFEPGQRCFREHKVPLERDPILLHQRMRHGVVAGTRRAEWADWRDSFNTEFGKAARDR